MPVCADAAAAAAWRPPRSQELVREETKAAVAVQTEQRAKQVAEAVTTVARAAREVDAAQAEATGQAQTLARAAQVGRCQGSLQFPSLR